MNESIANFQKLQEQANAIPSEDINVDLKCLQSLYDLSPIYYEFCISRFSLLGAHPETIEMLEKMVDFESNCDHYIALISILLNFSESIHLGHFLYNQVKSSNSNILSSYIINHKRLRSFGSTFLDLMFKDFSQQIIQIRDSVLISYLYISDDISKAIECLEKIPVSYSQSHYFEFCNLLSHISNILFKSNQKKAINQILDIAINASMVVSFPDSIISILNHFINLLPDCSFPPSFISYINQNYPEILEDLGIKHTQENSISEIFSLPILLRLYLVDLPPSSVDTPRLCRLTNNSPSVISELHSRILKENNPKLLHDLLIALSSNIQLSDTLPFRFTLLASAARKDPNLSNEFLSAFSSLSKETAPSIIFSAARALNSLAQINSPLVVHSFSQIRRLLMNCDENSSELFFDALSYPVQKHMLDNQFIWREYHNIRTIDYDELSNIPDLLHYSIIALTNDHDMKEILSNKNDLAADILIELSKKNINAVASALRRIPERYIAKYPKIIEIIPNLKTSISADLLPEILNEILENCKHFTTQQLLQLATVSILFPDVISTLKVKSPELQWMKLLCQVGDAVFHYQISQELFDMLIENAKSHQNDRHRFGSVFGLSVLSSYQLSPEPCNSSKMQDLYSALLSSSEDNQPFIRLIASYGLSFFTAPPNAILIIKKGLQRVKSKFNVDDAFGVGYLMCSWFAECISEYDNIKANYCNIPCVSAHIAILGRFLAKPQSKISNDALTLAQYIYLLRKYCHSTNSEKIEELYKTASSPEEIATAVYGYVPESAFLISDIKEDFTETQQDIVRTLGEFENSDLIRQIINRSRRQHPLPSAVENRKLGLESSFETLKKYWNAKSQDDQDKAILVAKEFSPLEFEQLCQQEANEDYTFFTAIIKREPEVIAQLWEIKQRSLDMVIRAKKTFSNCDQIVVEMLKQKIAPESIAKFISLWKKEEDLGEANMALFPGWLAQMKFDDNSIELIKNLGNEIAHEYVSCLLLMNPNALPSNPELFELFHD